MIFNRLPLFLANVLASSRPVGLIEGIAETTHSLLKIFPVFSERCGRARTDRGGYGLSPWSTVPVGVTSWLGMLAVRVVDRIRQGHPPAPRDALSRTHHPGITRPGGLGQHRAGIRPGPPCASAGLLNVLAPVRDGGPHPRDVQIAVMVSIVPGGSGRDRAGCRARDVPVNSQRADPQLRPARLHRRFLFLPAGSGDLHPGLIADACPVSCAPISAACARRGGLAADLKRGLCPDAARPALSDGSGGGG